MKCEFTKPDGEKCEAYAVKDSGYCYFHNPAVSDEDKRLAQVNGGKARALTLEQSLPALTINTPDDAIMLLVDTISRVRAGTLDIRTANCLGFLSDKLLKAFEVAKLNDKAEFIERVIMERRTKY